MDNLLQNVLVSAAVVGAVTSVVPGLKKRLQLSRAKHRSLAGHSRMAKRISRLIPFYDYDETRFFAADDAPSEIVLKRKKALDKLSAFYAKQYVRSAALTKIAAESISDLQFTGS